MINYDFAIALINTISLGLLFFMMIISWYYIASFFIACKKIPQAPHSDKKTKFAVIVPARNESQVIKRNLDSLLKQTYDKDFYDIWVIIESQSDPTYDICQKLGVHCFIRDNLTENRKRKGYAIQELYNYFERNNIKYDAFMFFDADNIVQPNYLEGMNDLRQTGVQVGTGYRNFTNAQQNWISCTSATFFTYMMSFTSRMRSYLFKKATLCGTGYFIDRQVIVDAGGWIFTGLTEDMQLTTYCYYHDVNMRFYPLVEFYDEQCAKYKTLHRQMLRWIYGYFESKKPFKQETINYNTLSQTRMFWAKFEHSVSFFPFVIIMVVDVLLFIISIILCAVSAIFQPQYTSSLFSYAMIQLISTYGVFCFIALVVILKDNKKLKFNFATCIWAILTYALFFAEILVAVIDGLFHKKKRTTWAPIEHTGALTQPDAKNMDGKK